ncbi:hypothetical protein TW81_05565 [Vibrio galatheae]|uniref:DUF2780 domain-containing protein n=1 Tax=Vibrio galatheae TaxID=579748 RepID=A0A0F4NN38_9VIBR|nr:DUF2780 domain-containing protein [Vibrio galatheae]KJY84263.1 hypothetical protein TW81_05565 [Vibrio galatheae]
MKKHVLLLSILSVSLLGCQATGSSEPSTTSTNSAYSDLASTALTGALQMWGQQNGSEDLTSSIQQATGVTSEQAAGGIGSLFALAQSSLGESQNSELGELIPGYDQLESSGLSSMITNSGALDSAFSALGMDPSMVSTFAPIVISALQSQGASSSLVQALSTLWQ